MSLSQHPWLCEMVSLCCYYLPDRHFLVLPHTTDMTLTHILHSQSLCNFPAWHKNLKHFRGWYSDGMKYTPHYLNQLQQG